VAALAACAAALCSTAAAAPGKLALMPLPKQSLGADAQTFALTKDSGVDSNATAARNAGVAAAVLVGDGRITGYALDYVRQTLPTILPATELLEVKSIAERYRDEATAAKGLRFWQGVTRMLTAGHPSGFTITLSAFRARVGDGTFAFMLRYRRTGAPTLYVGDVVFRTGDLLGAVFVTTTGDAGLRARTIHLAHVLATRIKRVAAGKIRHT
jgi:hypothetical protein